MIPEVAATRDDDDVRDKRSTSEDGSQLCSILSSIDVISMSRPSRTTSG